MKVNLYAEIGALTIENKLLQNQVKMLKEMVEKLTPKGADKTEAVEAEVVEE